MSDTAGVILAGTVLLGMAAMGIVLLTGRGAFLIAGYNTMPEEEKAKWNAAALCKFIGLMLLALTVLMGLCLAGAMTGTKWLLSASLAAFSGVVVFTLLYVNKSKRFRK